jgi:formate hydrogenlyase transcriptional activator
MASIVRMTNSPLLFGTIPVPPALLYSLSGSLVSGAAEDWIRRLRAELEAILYFDRPDEGARLKLLFDLATHVVHSNPVVKMRCVELDQEHLALRKEVAWASMREEIVGSSPALNRVLEHTAKVAPTDSTVLITGETGTGKELIARAIHKGSHRSHCPFVRVNCAALPASLIASELFGYEKGAFTGATQRRLGRFELANGGTIFLDEIGEISAETQIALLRVLQEREFERVGGNLPIPTDVRVLAATNRDLKAALEAGTFRQDLFYRLNVFPIHMPSLRERPEDILLLITYFIERYASKAGKKIRRIERKTLTWLQDYAWPGNIRELQNVVERAVILCDGDTFSIDESWLQPETLMTNPRVTLPATRVNEERKLIEAALEESRGRISGPSGAAGKLGMPRTTLESKIKSLRINKYQFKRAQRAFSVREFSRRQRR